MRIRAAILGCGNIAGGYDEVKRDGGCYTHAGAYRRCPEIELVAAADPDLARREAFGRHWDIPSLYADAATLLRQHEVDLVSVCVPDAVHEDIMTQVLAMQRPKVIFAEKPLALKRDAARWLLDRAKAVGTRVVVNHQRRWEPGHQQVRAMVQSGTIGQIVAVTAFYVKGLYHIGSTVIDTIRFLVSDVEAVQALESHHDETLPGDPSVDAVLYLRNRSVATMLGADRYGYRYSLFELDILGTAGRIRLLDNGDRIVVSRVQDYRHYPGFLELRELPGDAIPTDMGSAIPNGARDIVAFVRGERALSENDGEEGYRDLCVVDAVAASKAQGGARIPVVP